MCVCLFFAERHFSTLFPKKEESMSNNTANKRPLGDIKADGEPVLKKATSSKDVANSSLTSTPVSEPGTSHNVGPARPQITKIDGKWVFPEITKEQTEEAKRFLKDKGVINFLDKYLPDSPRGSDIVYITGLLGFFPFSMTEDIDDETNLMKVVKTLQRAMNKVIHNRLRITDMNTVAQAVDAIKSAKNIIVLTGAGISTSLGIPDFRSAKGIYSLVDDLGLDDPQQVFDLETFRYDPEIFYKVAHMILPPEGKWTPTHAFIKELSNHNKLLRNYTQNIDNLEASVGIPKDKYIQCHGSFAHATCRTCGYKVDGTKIFPVIRAQQLPVCARCFTERKQRLQKSDSVGDLGIMKPDITFFGEDLPRVFYENLPDDIRKCDLLICIGTSLKVAPVNEIVNKIRPEVPQILINKDDISHAEFDISLLGYCDEVTVYLTNKLGWSLEVENYKELASQRFEVEEEDKTLGVYQVHTFKD